MYLKQTDPSTYWGLDIEADSLTPTKIHCVCVENLVSGEQRTFTEKEEFNEFLSERASVIFLGHNLLSFDVPVLNSLWSCGINFDNCIDTLVLSYLYNPALQEGHSLDAWGDRLKFPKISFNDFTRYTPEMEKYCKQDVSLTLRVYKALQQKMLRLGYSELSCQIEHKIRIIIDEQQRNGFWFDKSGGTRLRSELRRLQSDLSERIQLLFPPIRTQVAEYIFRRRKDGSPTASYENHRNRYEVVHYEKDGKEVYSTFELQPFNLGSPIQRVKRLLALGWEPENFTKNKTHEFPRGFPKVDEDALVKFAEQSGRPEVLALAEWLVLQGRASMLDTWFNNLGEDSRIHGKIITCGASTRRMTHNSPNTANIPSGAKAKYGHECRALWGVEPGRGLVLVGYDASGLETAGLCHYLNNPKATEVLLRPKPFDVHTVNAERLSEALGWVCDREWAAKTSWYAWLYGAYPPKLGSIVRASQNGMREADAGEIVVDTFFRNVPGLKELINSVQSEWKTGNQRLRTIDGGFVVCPNLNAVLNYKIQSLGAILMKLSSILLREEADRIGLEFKKVADVHDESQMETLEENGEQLGKLAVWSIEESARQLKLNTVVTGSYLVGQNWGSTH